MEIVTAEDVQEKLSDANTEVINVLSAKNFNRLHIKGSRNIPLDQLQEDAWQNLDEDKEYIVYCLDEECGASPRAAEFLAEKGFTVKDYEAGIKDWAEKELPVEGEMSRDEYLDLISQH